MFDIFFLGTGASVPSKERALPCVALRRGPDVILFDCGEGSQRQLMISPLSFMKIGAVFITHLHGDHFYGLPGLLQTMGMSNRKNPLTICGPEGIADAVKTSLAVCEGDIGYGLEIREMSPGDTVTAGEISVTAYRTEHGIASLGYVAREPDTRGKIDAAKAGALGIRGKDFSVLEAGGEVNGVRLSDVVSSSRKGISVAYSGDTEMCQTEKDAVRGTDVLIHESTYADADSDLAAMHHHSTAAQAAALAAESGCRALMLVHTSGRYKDSDVILTEAGRIFRKTFLPCDFSQYCVTAGDVRSVSGCPPS